MGFSVLFSNIVNFGLYGLGIAWIVTPLVILFMWFFGTRVLKMDNKPLVITPLLPQPLSAVPAQPLPPELQPAQKRQTFLFPYQFPLSLQS